MYALGQRGKRWPTFRMRLFKHLQREYIDRFFETGEIRIGNFKYYKSIENESIRDISEGITLSTKFISKEEITFRVKKGDGEFESASEEDKNFFKPLEMSFSKKVHIPDSYIYCLSKSDLPNSFLDYDACFEILKPIEFFNELSKQLFLKDKIPIENYRVAEVKYIKDKMIDVRHSIPAFWMYWIKEISYKADQEVRAVFPTSVNNPHEILEPVTITSKILKDYCVRIR